MKPKPKDSRGRLMTTPRLLSTRESKSNFLKPNHFRRYLILEDQYKQMQAEYNENKNKIMALIPTKEDELKKEADKRHQLAVLANEKVLLNDTIGINRKLKGEIDIMRKEIFFAKEQNTKMEN